ncbi:MAG: hypothetical protein JNM07_07125 [Phycisphaerae bacterium]|nr:hypothetical protein [Phycisphaerae bacterium]
MTDDRRELELRAVRLLRAQLRAEALHNGMVTPVRFVIDPSSGRLVFPAPPAILRAPEIVLSVPRDEDGSLQLMVDLTELDANREAVCDRWMIYHGKNPFGTWVALTATEAKHGRRYVDGWSAAALVSPDWARGVEPELCRLANGDRAALRSVCREMARTEVDEALCVGIDDAGMDVRARFSIVRIDFVAPAADVSELRAAVGQILRSARGGSGAAP